MSTATMQQTQASNTTDKSFFILYKPKDIVSGDFYYAQAHKPKGSKNELFYICTADCTGHGVPGALMSMVGISRLNESIIEKGLIHPNEILDNMRNGIISSLNPEGSEEESKDGMDCVLCVYDFENGTMEFAAANNPLWHVRDGKVTEYKPDKMPVGKYGEEMKPFTLHKIELQKGDIIYTFTDGYADQFGGPKGKKFKYKQLEELLLKNCHLPMDVQKEKLNHEFESWKGNLEQVDDICVIGIKI
jgi:serine phosphatase RsbU (regulator of sigma subunit)